MKLLHGEVLLNLYAFMHEIRQLWPTVSSAYVYTAKMKEPVWWKLLTQLSWYSHKFHHISKDYTKTSAFHFFFKNCAYVQPTIIRRTGFVKVDGHIKRSSMQNLLKFKKYHKFNWSLKLQALVKDALALWRNVIKCNHLVLLHLKCVHDKKINNWF